MPTLQATEAPLSHGAPDIVAPLTAPSSRSAPGATLRTPHGSLLSSTVTASVAAHLLLIAWLGSGIPEPVERPTHPTEPVVAPIEVETVVVAPEPEALQTPEPADTAEPTLDAPPNAPLIDSPALPEVQAVTAVPASVPVSFGVEVKGPVRIVSDAALAAGGAPNARRAQPVALDAASEQNLVIPAISYPARAKRQRLTGTVWVEFRTTQTGEITDVRVRETSGHRLLDEAATKNLREGRWKGRPGFYVKGYEFLLQ